ncbi:MAG TPA: IS66 family transposase [Thermomicrobiales bacterium]|nr:IS66 family transposase [Thermomicrobiales bacterium]
MMLDREALERMERAALVALALAQQARLAALEAQVAVLTARVEELGGRPPAPPAPPTPPAFVKPATPPKPPRRPRQRRPVGFARRRAAPTRIVEHAVDTCPACGAALRGGAVVRRRQILHIPPAHVEVIAHVVRRRVCPRCGRAHPPPLDLGDEVLGHHRVSLEPMAYSATLRAAGRLPLRVLQGLLAARHGLQLSVGALVGVLRAVADRARPALAALRAPIRGSPVVGADRGPACGCGWREDGANGDVWVCTTPQACSCHYDRSRAGAVVTEVLGAEYDGVLVSDCYAAYNIHEGDHQRCWAHLLRDVHDLRLAHPADAAVQAWADAVHAVYLAATRVAAEATDFPARVAARAALERRLTALCAPYWQPGAAAPQATLCRRVDRFLDELFMFILDPAIPADNTLAERRLRPLVIARKSSGGTRAEDGATTRMALASLCATWQAQGRDPFTACRDLLRQSAPAR